MKTKELIEKLEKSKAYKDFKKSEEGKKAFLCAVFLIMNFKSNSLENSLDFRNEKNIFTFKLPQNEKEEIIMQKEDLIPSRKQLGQIDEKMLSKLKADIGDLENHVKKELEKNKISNPLEEIITVLQASDENKSLVWNLTCIAQAFTIISMSIDALEGKTLKFDKKNLLDFVSVRKPENK